MQSEDAKYLKKKIKGGNIDVHPTEKAIVVYYEVEATILGELGDPMLGEKKECQKVIRLRSLNESTDIKALAEEVVEKCKLIPVTKLPEVEQLLFYLQKRKNADKEGPAGKSSKGRKQGEDLQDPTPDCFNEELSFDGETPSVNNIDDYVELLYEDVPSKIKASIMLICLIKNSDNLEALLEHETVMGALSRVLREDWRKSVELSTNLMYIFFCFSTYTQFHRVLAHYKIGALCLSIADFELNRQATWKSDLEKRKRSIPDDQDKEQSLKEFDKLQKKYQGLIKKQDQLLRVAFYLLLNLSEDARVEIKMKNKGIVKILMKALETRDNTSLLVVVVTFLKKLSIFVENKNEMDELDIIGKLNPYVPSNDELLCSLTLRLLLNLSFDIKLRHKMVEQGFLPRIISTIDHPAFQTVTICLLYHLSIDDKARSLFSYTDCIPKLVQMILEAPIGPINIEVAALCINIATKKRNTQMICEYENSTALKHLVKRVFKCKDGLLMKMVRNMSQHEGNTKPLFVSFISTLASAIKKEKDEDFVIECLGTLANLNMANINFELVLSKYDLMPFILKVLRSGQSEDDLVLETVVLIGTIALDENCAGLLAQSNIIQVLIDLLGAKQEDDELVLQISYAFYQMIWHEDTRNVLISQTQAPAYMIDLMHDRNAEIRKVNDSTLDIIREYDSEWEKRIQTEKFKWHNSQWIEMVETQQMVDEEDMYDDVLPQYHHDDDLLLYEPNFHDEMMMENSGLNPEYIDEEVLRNNLVADPSMIMPSGYPAYMHEYGNAMHNAGYMGEEEVYPDEYYHQSYARPTTPEYMSYHNMTY